ncbi:hypothetical protein [Nonomuraea sediminis]|uniref:hypothetical protein n=1 Tax=Nonomuraea sediminis TaxID=2835864 RepID=UPI001BDCAF72|nr:hypothetical protein [Nonomuraea sediminis]
MTLTEAQTRAAVTHARFAARRAWPMTSCPYAGRTDDIGRALTLVWVRAYLAIRPPTTDADHSGRGA